MRTDGTPRMSRSGDISTQGVPLSRSAASTSGLSHSGGVRIMPSGRSASTMRSICWRRSGASLCSDSTTR